MSKIMKKRAFTLIELIAILVILAILALIVTPLVMNIIRKAGIVANRRSVDLAITSYLLETGTFPTDLSDLTDFSDLSEFSDLSDLSDLSDFSDFSDFADVEVFLVGVFLGMAFLKRSLTFFRKGKWL